MPPIRAHLLAFLEQLITDDGGVETLHLLAIGFAAGFAIMSIRAAVADHPFIKLILKQIPHRIFGEKPVEAGA